MWFSTAAVAPSISQEWGLVSHETSWLTMSVQIGFVVGALLSAAVNLADRVSPHALMTAAALLAGSLTLMFAWVAPNLSVAIALRFLTGVALAGIYPVGVKVTASWFRQGRALAMGIMIGATALGSATPHLITGFGAPLPWRTLLTATSVLCGVAALIALMIREGPNRQERAPLRPGYLLDMFRDPAQRRVNLGYFGHMWELYGFWTWLPMYLTASLVITQAQTSPDTALLEGQIESTVGMLSYLVIGICGAAGCVLAGIVAKKLGSCRVASWSLAMSGVCCVASIAVFGLSTWILIPFLCVWGVSVVADSAQFSAELSHKADPRYVGTALTLQMAVGFLITAVTIQIVPIIAAEFGWRWSFLVLALGPLCGVLAMKKRSQLPVRQRA
ncbi:MFS transporter [Leucobacter denitrificans]|uniref:MFS transporter n=1 Tax=Leucobacter denitrificans TaxID=683042 RepID=A0A7G9S3E8_9MICO|nr:MFS transporter [Leucobacter denitrificans]QNN62373.1 MFS transporter [Leucobacter denitrificans]